MIEKFNQIVKTNQSKLEYIKSRNNSKYFDKKILGTVDTAVHRMNNILLILSQYPLIANDVEQDLCNCQQALSDLIFFTKKMDKSNFILKKYYQFRIHLIGKIQITKIKKLLEKIEKQKNDI